jgi:phosphoribosylformimino-5-aminoimidazole carboxamide ribotide isomerase
MFERFTVIPAIDLKRGAVVRLHQGDMARATVYGTDPAVVARTFEKQGAELIHIVDLDGATAGAPRNLDAVRAIRHATSCQLDISGGLRTLESVRAIIGAGADYISIGSAAFLEPQLLNRVCAELPGRVFGSVDARYEKLLTKGWVETRELTIKEAIDRFVQAGVAALILTDVSRDGTEAGSNVNFFSGAASTSKRPLIASGGVRNLQDIRALRGHFANGIAGVIVGRALYEQRFTLGEALSA